MALSANGALQPAMAKGPPARSAGMGLAAPKQPHKSQLQQKADEQNAHTRHCDRRDLQAKATIAIQVKYKSMTFVQLTETLNRDGKSLLDL